MLRRIFIQNTPNAMFATTKEYKYACIDFIAENHNVRNNERGKYQSIFIY